MKIVKLHGTCGAGKSTIARGLMELGAVTLLYGDNPKKPEAYRVDMPEEPSLYILGPYTTQCGGLDSLDSDTCVELIGKYGYIAQQEGSNVFYESMIASGFYGRMGTLSEQWGDDHIFAFMTTPLEECIRRTEQRRQAKGNMKPLDPKNVIWKHDAMLRLKAKLVTSLNRNVREVSNLDDVVALYGY